jgi:hypothetical protein
MWKAWEAPFRHHRHGRFMANHCTTSITTEECCASLQESWRVSSHLLLAQRYGPGTWVTAAYLRASLSITELCQLYHLSRKTSDTWIDRYLKFGPAGLEERSRKPATSPRQTAFRTGPGAYSPAQLIGDVRHCAWPSHPSPARAGRGRREAPRTTGQKPPHTRHRGRSRR